MSTIDRHLNGKEISDLCGTEAISLARNRAVVPAISSPFTSMLPEL